MNYLRKNITQARALVALLSLFLFTLGCSKNTTTSEQIRTLAFDGAASVNQSDNGTWTLKWSTVNGADDIRYLVFSRTAQNLEFDFANPIQVTAESQYVSGDLRLIGSTCFVVRASQGGKASDANKKEICTGHEAFNFTGAEKITGVKNSSSYILSWPKSPFREMDFEVFARKTTFDGLKTVPTSLDSYTLVGTTRDDFFKSPEYKDVPVVCFLIRYKMDGFPQDKNFKELCSARTGEGRNISVQPTGNEGEVRVSWVPSTAKDISGYNVYLDVDFKNKAAFVNGGESSSTVIKNLPHAVKFSFGVRALDNGGREEISRDFSDFVLPNRLPEISSLTLIPVVDADALRPQKLICTAEYSDKDKWQTLTPTFRILVRKRGLALNSVPVERLKSVLPAGVKSIEYSLSKVDDLRADQVFCELSVKDSSTLSGARAENLDPGEESGAWNTTTKKSASWRVPDTAPVATGKNVAIPKGQSTQISLKRANVLTDKEGYVDVDIDDAIELEITDISYVTESSAGVKSIVQSIPDTTGVKPAFQEVSGQVCNFGECRFMFLPKNDYMSMSAGDLVEVSYRVRTGEAPLAGFCGVVATSTVPKCDNNISDTGKIIIRVLPLPIATGFSPRGTVKDGGSIGIEIRPGTGLGYSYAKSSSLKMGDIEILGKENAKPEILIYKLLDSSLPSALETLPCTGSGCTVATKLDLCAISATAPYIGTPSETNNDRYCSGSLSPFVCGTGTQGPICTATFTPRDKRFFTNDKKFIYAGFQYRVKVTDPDTGIKLTSESAYAYIDFHPPLMGTGVNVLVEEGETAEVAFQRDISNQSKGYVSTPDYVVSDVLTQSLSGSRPGNRPNPLFPNLSAFVCETKAPNGDAAGTTCTPAVHNTEANIEAGSVCATRCTSSLSVGTSAFGMVNFDYVLAANRADGAAGDRIISEPVKATVEFYPKPRTTSVSTAALECSEPTLQVSPGGELEAKGYWHPKGDSAALLEVTSGMSGFQFCLDSTCMPSSTIGTTAFRCVGGTCESRLKSEDAGTSINSEGERNCFVGENSFQYKIRTTSIPLNKIQIAGNAGNFNIDFRPKAKARNLPNLVGLENRKFTLNFRKSLNFSDVTAGNAEYSHSGGLAGIEVSLTNNNPNDVVLTVVGCAPSGVCTIEAMPNAGFNSSATFEYSIAVQDPKLGKVFSEPKRGTIDFRPLPKANSTTVVSKTEFQKSISFTSASSYSHKYNFKASRLEVTGVRDGSLTSLQNCVGAALTQICEIPCDASGVCDTVFTSSADFYGATSFKYRSVVYDAKLLSDSETSGYLKSDWATVNLDVRPVPTGQVLTWKAVENQNKTFTFKLGDVGNLNGYRHGYSYPATSIQISNLNASKATLENLVCVKDATGICTVELRPAPNTYGTLSFNFDISTVDSVWGGLINSADSAKTGIVNVDVYPAARATGRNLVAIENRTKRVRIALNQGYTHSYNHKASKVTVKTGSSKNGAVSLFVCDATGICEADFQPALNYVSTNATATDRAEFTYTVEVGGVTSNEQKVILNVRPLPRVPEALAAVRQLPTVSPVILRLNEGYTYVLGAKAVAVTTSNLAKGTFAPFTCANGICTANYTPQASFFGATTATYKVTVEDDLPSSIAELSTDPAYASLFSTDTNTPKVQVTKLQITSDDGPMTIDVRPTPLAPGYTFRSRQDTNGNVRVQFAKGYNHPYANEATKKYLASAVRAVSAPRVVEGKMGNAQCVNPGCDSNFGLSAFTCTDGLCLATMTSVNKDFSGIVALDYTASVLDEKLGTLVSVPGTLNMDFRALPIATGRVDFVAIENVSNVNIKVGPGETEGYIHREPYTLPAYKVTTFGVSGGTVGSFSCNVAGLCQASFIPAPDFYGIAKVGYRVTIKDPELGDLDSNDGELRINVRPIPKAKNIVVTSGIENTTRSVVVQVGSASDANVSYPHENPTYTLASDALNLEVSSLVSLVVNNTTCVTNLCTITYTPSSNFYGDASFKYKVLVGDAIYAGNISSLEKKVTVNVYPRPRASGLLGNVTGVQFSPKTVPLKKTTWALFNNGSEKNGYAHPTGRNASKIEVFNYNSSQIQFSNATCADGVCTLTCDPTTGDCNFNASPIGAFYGPSTFSYFVYVRNPVTSEEIKSQGSSTATVQFYPLPVGTNLLTKRIPEGAARKVKVSLVRKEQIAAGTAGQGYSQDYDEPASSIEVTPGTVNNGSVSEFVCSSSTVTSDPTYGVCEATFTPTAGYVGTGAGFKFRVTVKGLQSPLESEYKIQVYPVLKSKDISFVGIQNESVNTTKKSVSVVIKRGTSLNSAYTHAYSEPVDSVFVLGADSSQGTLSNFSCNTNSSDGRCTATFIPADGFYGTAYINYILRSNSLPDFETPFRRISINVHPVPISSGRALFAKENSNEAISLSPSQGYTHPYGDKATEVVVGTTANGMILNNEITCAASGICSGVFSPQSNYVGNATFDYVTKISVPDVLDTPNINVPIVISSRSATVTVNVRPRPRTSGKSIVVVEGQDALFNIERGTAVEKKGFVHVAPTEFNGAEVSVTSVSNGLALLESLCTSTGSCPMRFRPSPANFYGLAGFEYGVAVNDIVMNGPVESVPLDATNPATKKVSIDYRPQPKSTGKTLTVLENSSLINPYPSVNTFTISLGDGYTYPASYPKDSVALTIVPGSLSKGTVSDVNCVTGTCTARFNPTPDAFGVDGISNSVSGGFKYKVSVNDAVINQIIESPEAEVRVNIQPVPDSNAMVFKGIEGSPVPIKVQRFSWGAVLNTGYTHPFNYNANQMAITNLDSSKGSFNGSVSCNSQGSCEGIFTPAAGVSGDILFDFRVRVGTDAWSNISAGKITLYPKPVTNPVSVWSIEGRETIISLSPSSTPAAYSHVLSHKAKAIEITNIAGGSATADVCDVDGVCNVKFNSSVLGTGTFDFRVATEDPVSKTLVFSSYSTATVSVRERPRSTGVALSKFENDVATVSVKKGAGLGYLYNGAGTVSAVASSNLLPPDGTSVGSFNCTGATNNAKVCDASYTPKTNFTGVAQFTYTVTVNDPMAGNIVSDPAVVQITYYPRPRTQPITVTNGIEGRDLYVYLMPNQAYTHEYSHLAQSVRVETMGDGNGTVGGEAPLCFVETGICSVKFSPAANFYSATNTSYAKFKFWITVGGAESPLPALAQIYFKPVPHATGYSDTLARSGDSRTVTLALGAGYTMFGNKPATGIVVDSTSLTQSSISAFTCTVAGVCTAEFLAVGSGERTFQYKVEANGEISNTYGTASVVFRPVPRTNNLTLAMVENRSTNFDIKIPDAYSHDQNKVPNITAGANVKPVDIELLPAGQTNISVGSFTCSTSGEPICSASVTPNSTFVGPTSFRYRVWVDGLDSNWSTVTVPVESRVKTEVLNYVGETVRGYQAAVLNITMRNGTDYRNVDGNKANQILIKRTGYTPSTLKFNGFLISEYEANTTTNPCVGDYCVLPTSLCDPTGTGNCVLPLTAGSSFFGTGSFSYKLKTTDGFVSTEWKAANVEFYPTPIASYSTTVLRVLQNNPLTVLLKKITLQGYTHPDPYNHPAQAVVDVSAPNGTISTPFACSATTGDCTGVYTPTTNYKSTAGTPVELSYKINVGTAVSANIAKVLIDVYPQALATTFTIPNKVQGNPIPVTFTLNSLEGYTHERSDKATAVIVDETTLVGGTVTTPFACDVAGTCTGVFTPDSNFYGQVSTIGSGKPPAKFNYKLTVGGFPSTIGVVSMDIKPKPVATGGVIENAAVHMRTKSNVTIALQAGGYTGYTHPSNEQATNVEIISRTGMRGTLGEFTCATGICTATYSYFGAPLPAMFEDKFTYRVKILNDNNFWSNSAEGIIQVKPLLQLVNKSITGTVTPGTPITVDIPIVLTTGYIPGVTGGFPTSIDVPTSVAGGSVTGTCDTAAKTCNIRFVSSVAWEGGDSSFTYRLTDGTANYWSAPGNVTVFYEPLDKAPTVIAKTGTNALVVYKNTPRTFEVTSGDWYTDPDGIGDRVADSGGFIVDTAPASGTITDIVCSNATGKCTFTYTPALNYVGTVSFYFTIKTKSAVYSTSTRSSASTLSAFVVQVPPTPVPVAFSGTGTEDIAYSGNVRSGAATGYKTPAEMSLLATPWGHFIYADKITITGAANALPSCAATYTSFPCDITCDTSGPTRGQCNFTFMPDPDFYGPATFTYKVTANGVQSTAVATATVNFTNTPDAPIAINKRHDWVPYDGQYGVRDHAYGGLMNKDLELRLARWGVRPSQIGYTSHSDNLGYSDADDDIAVAVETRNVTNGTLLSGFTCDAAGLCKANFRAPTGYTGAISLEYRVRTAGDAVWSNWASMYGTIYANDTPAVASAQTLDMMQNGTKTIIIRGNGGYTKSAYRGASLWWSQPSRFATSLVTSNAAKGTIGAFTCAEGWCLADFIAQSGAFTTTPGTVAQMGGFDFKVVTGENFVGLADNNGPGYDFGNTLRQESNISRVNLNINPAPITKNFDLNTAKNTPVAISINYNQHYTHVLSLKAVSIEVSGLVNGTLPAFTCNSTTGNCTSTFTPTAGFGGEASFDFNVTDTAGRKSSGSGRVKIIVDPVVESKSFAATTLQEQDVSVVIDYGTAKQYSSNNGQRGSSITVSSLSGASVQTAFACDGAGKCTGLIRPNVGFSGVASFNYIVTLTDGKPSNTSTVTITVTPRALATGVTEAGDKTNSTHPVTIAMGAGQGYTHPTNSKATSVTVSNLVGGTVGAFTCNSFGACTAAFNPVGNPDNASFNYKVATDGVDSTQGLFSISYLYKAIPIASVSTAENTSKTVSIARGSGLGYSSPTSQYASQINIRNIQHGTITSCAGACTLNCTVSGSTSFCNVPFLPTSGFFSLNGVNASFEYSVTFSTAGGVETNYAQQDIVVTHVDTAPVAQNLTLTNGEQGRPVLVVLAPGAGYTDLELNSPTSVTLGTLTNLSVVSPFSCVEDLCSGVFLPTDGFYGSGSSAASFQFQVTANGKTSGTGLVKIDILPVPQAKNSSLVIGASQSNTILIKHVQDYTYPTATATAISLSSPVSGTVGTSSCASGQCTFEFIAQTGFSGAGSVKFKVTADGRVSSEATITFDIRPVVTVRALSVNAVTGVAQTLTFSPVSAYEHITNLKATNVTVSNLSNATAQVQTPACNGTGDCFVTLTATTQGAASFNYTITTSDGKTSALGLVSITASAANAAPVATGRNFSGATNASIPLTLALANGYTDAESDKATQIFVDYSSGGSVSGWSCGSTGTCTASFVSKTNFSGLAVVGYRVNAGGKTSNQGVMLITVTASGSEPFALAWSSLTIDSRCAVTAGVTSTPLLDSNSFDASAAVDFTNSGIAASLGGFSTVISPSATASFYTEFTATDKAFSSNSVSIGRKLMVTSAAPGFFRSMGPLSVSLVDSEGTPGRQQPFEGCVGQSCTGALGAVATGLQFSCAINPDTTVSCWGLNDKGQLGNGTSIDSAIPTKARSFTDDSVNTYLTGVTALVAGDSHVCALTTGRKVACWGSNAQKQLGYAGTPYRTNPELVTMSNSTALSNITQITAGKEHTCALSTSKTAWCWGNNVRGQLGNGLTLSDTANHTSLVPLAVNSAASTPMTDIYAISAGGSHTCAIQISNYTSPSFLRTVKCWGDNSLGQIGRSDASVVNPTLFPVEVVGTVGTPTTLPTADGLSLGDNHSCAVLRDGSVKCWGDNSTGQLGRAAGASTYIPGSVAIVGDTPVVNAVAIEASFNQTCALHKDQSVSCWGENSSGALGNQGLTDTSVTYRSRAIKVWDATASAALGNVYAVSVGKTHTCVLFKSTNNQIRCWGSNLKSELGLTASGNVTAAGSAVVSPTAPTTDKFVPALRQCTGVFSVGVAP